MGQQVGVAISQHAHQRAGQMAGKPNHACAHAALPGQRWVAELTLERRQGDSVTASWTETRTLDRDEEAVAMRYAAQFRTEIGTRGSRGAEWRVTPAGTFIGTQTDAGDRWVHRSSEERETTRILRVADGMLQALLDAAGGWTRTDAGWVLGDQPLRCGQAEPRSAFLARFDATATHGELQVDDGQRTLHATWKLPDGSELIASYNDRVVDLPEAVAAPPPEMIVPIDRDRSLHRARELLSKLAEDGLATVASPADTSTGTQGESKPDR